MSHKLTIDTSYGKAPSDGGFLRVLPSVYLRPEDCFKARLDVLKESYHGDTVLAETDPCILPVPFSRMLERVARGRGAKVVGSPWCGIHPGEHTRSICDFGIGSATAKVLIVGWNTSHKLTADEPELPFVSVNPHGCAYKLTAELERMGIREKDLYWINAMDRHGEPHEAGSLLLEPWRLVLALGWEPYHWAIAQGFQKVVSVPPATWYFSTPRKGVYRGVQLVAGALAGKV